MFVGTAYQIAYVTRNLDIAVERFKANAAVRQDLAFHVPTKISTPGGPADMDCKIAMLWVGDTQYELIEPVGGYVGAYREALPDDDRLVFHHVCTRVPDWDAFRASVDDQPLPIAFEGEAGPLRFLYLDGRATCGHYLEFTAMPEPMWQAMGGR